MGQERLAVNVFPGVLPGSYIFLDDCSDNSKWINSAANPWDGITTGAAYGYYGSGLHFDMSCAGGGAVNSKAYRYPMMPQYMLRSADFYWGFKLRPHLVNYVAGPVVLPIYVGLQFCRGIFDVATIFHMAVKFTYRTSSLSRIVSEAWLAKNITLSPLAETTQRITGMDNGIQSVQALPPWISVSICVENNSVVLVKINDDVIPISPIFPLGGDDLFTDEPLRGSAIFLCANNPSGAKVSNYGFDLDQIWISDTENRV